MKLTLAKYRPWFEARPPRERILTILLACASVYGLISLIFITPVDIVTRHLNEAIEVQQNDIKNWDLRFDALNNIANSSTYRQWLSQNQALLDLTKKYQALVKEASVEEWQNIIKTISESQKIKIIQLRDFPASALSEWKYANTKTELYQQRFMLVFSSDYFTTLAYLTDLEKAIPNFHWDRLSYNVENYPVATIHAEFSYFYERHL